jgi:hypothetical protein
MSDLRHFALETRIGCFSLFPLPPIAENYHTKAHNLDMSYSRRILDNLQTDLSTARALELHRAAFLVPASRSLSCPALTPSPYIL